VAGNTEEYLDKILKSLDKLEYIKSADIPNIDLYMDQVTTFIPPPVKKKYSKEHVLLLIFIYYYKGIMSISDIQTLLGPVTEQFFQKSGELNLEDIYEEVFSMEKEQIEILKKDIVESYKKAETTFADAPEESREFLRKFAFICLLAFDVYEKKLIIEKMIDEMRRDMKKDLPKEAKREAKKETKKEVKK